VSGSADSPLVKRADLPLSVAIFHSNSSLLANRLVARIGSSTDASDIIDESGNTNNVTRSFSSLVLKILIAQIVNYFAFIRKH
jgi:hypothetical protein